VSVVTLVTIPRERVTTDRDYPRAGSRESQAFTKALMLMIAAGLHTHCSDSRTKHMWLSEAQRDRNPD
jgi:hypothetical protein